ncbi:cytochrome c oxidase subunit II [Mucilaginibacter limnophilus]|uniref:Cytochrome c oxidase subunit 2 n=1 Tax=Mucilaginibacter limnophilus TaxID=1932778 RepID=A0A3S2VNI2_9SPHI|nr:cytochrome c oxidase subunit II [Mucilaginibacter limnophilus]RVU01549.1 cytochrome c oxidase subunit II [Mucilaginibacter limnophilus]
MAFKQLINSKKLFSLLAMLILFGTQVLFAQVESTTAGEQGAPAAAAHADKPDVWAGVSYYVLLFLVVCVAVAIVGKILKVYDLTRQIQGKKGLNWNNVMGGLFLLFLVLGLYGSYWSFTVHGSMILPEAASIHGAKLDTMFYVTFGITVVVFVITQILLFGFAFLYRGSDKRKATYYPHNNAIEAAWTIAPAIVLTVLVVFGFLTWQKITNTVDAEGEPASINIEVVAHQFAWELRYPGKDQKLGNMSYKLVSGTNKVGVDFKDKNSFDDQMADTLVIPVNKSIKLNIHSQDVIHSVYMPHFRVQMNAVPGLPTYFKFTPTMTTQQMKMKEDDAKFEYLLYCNKICGGGHYNMKKVVRVVTEGEYQKWLSQQKPYLNDALKAELGFAKAEQKQGEKENRLAVNN